MEPCEDPACSDKLDMLRKMMRHNSKVAASKQKRPLANDPPERDSEEGCPLDKRELGQATWGLLHTTAAYYPDAPTEAQQTAASNLITGLAALYPCSYCAKDFQKEVKKSPPAVASREKLSLWMCEQHNIVNRKLGMPEVQCTLELLDRRWKKGHKGCFPDADTADRPVDA
eukprot:6427-Heterococcus_DN1.PRE.12